MNERTETVCGIDCNTCAFKGECGGCVKSGGKPFGEACPVAVCCFGKKQNRCSECGEFSCTPKERLIAEFNALGIEDMEKVTNLNVLRGSYVNLEYSLPSGEKTKFLNDNKLYFGNQICKKGANRFYGLIADENFLLVCEYGQYGSDPEVIIYKKR